MSVKDFKKYYNEICDQYLEMKSELKDFEQECAKGLFEPERLDTIKETIRPLMDNYERVSYIMFLLNQPTRKEKIKKYEQQNKKLLSNLKQSNSLEAVKEENKQVIEDLKKITK